MWCLSLLLLLLLLLFSLLLLLLLLLPLLLGTRATSSMVRVDEGVGEHVVRVAMRKLEQHPHDRAAPCLSTVRIVIRLEVGRACGSEQESDEPRVARQGGRLSSCRA